MSENHALERDINGHTRRDIGEYKDVHGCFMFWIENEDRFGEYMKKGIILNHSNLWSYNCSSSSVNWHWWNFLFHMPTNMWEATKSSMQQVEPNVCLHNKWKLWLNKLSHRAPNQELIWETLSYSFEGLQEALHSLLYARSHDTRSSALAPLRWTLLYA